MQQQNDRPITESIGGIQRGTAGIMRVIADKMRSQPTSASTAWVVVDDRGELEKHTLEALTTHAAVAIARLRQLTAVTEVSPESSTPRPKTRHREQPPKPPEHRPPRIRIKA